MKRHVRGQAVTELALGLLILVPTLLITIYLSEAAMFRLEATEAATEPLWDATARLQQSYTGNFNRTPAARATATSDANGRMRGRSLLFTSASAPRVQCSGAPPMGYTVNGVMGAYDDNGSGITCTARLSVGAKDLPRNFLDQNASGFFKEPMSNLRRNFDFCETESCQPFTMSFGDWGMTNQGAEENECHLTMDSCANPGFFGKAKTVYEDKADMGGTEGDSNVVFMEQLMNLAGPPQDYARVTDFQMSFRGEESTFRERVPVAEGEPVWRTTPFFTKREESYNNRSSRFLGL